MGCQEVLPEDGRVLFAGDMALGLRVNIRSRYAERVLLLLGSFSATSFEELFQGVRKIPWPEYLARTDSFPVSGMSLASVLRSVPDCQRIIKKAIVERMKEKYQMSRFPETGTLRRVRFLIRKDLVRVMIDMSGEGLHKRGYRKQSTAAPIKETLAAGMAKLSRVRRDGHMVDPFCGSGTILIESALLAMNMAPGLHRRFQAESWPELPESLWKQERESAAALIRRDAGFQGVGYDIDPLAVDLAQHNAKKAGVGDRMTIRVQEIAKFADQAPYGCLICNPPYGERLLEVSEARALYRVMGQVFQRKRGWNYSVISPDDDFESLFGRKADKRRKLYNGLIRCQLYMYFK